MARSNRREFLRQAAHAGLALGVGSQLGVLTGCAGSVDPETLILRGTENVAVVDASLIPTVVAAHPVGTIMAIADRAGDILVTRWI